MRGPWRGRVLILLRDQQGGQMGEVTRARVGRVSGTVAKGRVGRSSPADKGGRAFWGKEGACAEPGGMRGHSAQGKGEIWFDWKTG